MLFFINALYCPFLEYRNSLCLNLSTNASSAFTSSDINICYRNKKEPVWSQQFLIKRDCDSDTGLKYSLFLLRKLITFVRNMVGPIQSQQFLVKRDYGSRQIFLISFFYPLWISFSSANCSILLSFSRLYVVRISFGKLAIVCLLKLFLLMILLSSKGLNKFT